MSWVWPVDPQYFPQVGLYSSSQVSSWSMKVSGLNWRMGSNGHMRVDVDGGWGPSAQSDDSKSEQVR
jgi:hypothetical protein